MTKYFPGVTHAIVRTISTKEEMDFMNGMLAFVTICFGPDDDNAIDYIGIKKMQGPASGVTAHIPMTPTINKLNMKIYKPTIVGNAADELKVLALIAFDKVKQKYGLKFNKKYKVFEKTIEEIGVTDA